MKFSFLWRAITFFAVFGKPITTIHLMSDIQPMRVTTPAILSDHTLCTRTLAIPIESEMYPARNTMPGLSVMDFMYPTIIPLRANIRTLRIKKDTPQNCARNAVVIRKT
jgi:hypothetical protein